MKRRIGIREKRRRLLQAVERRGGVESSSPPERKAQLDSMLSGMAARYRTAIDEGRLLALTRDEITAAVEPEQGAFGILFEWLAHTYPDMPEPERIYCAGAMLAAPSRKKAKGRP